MTDYTPITDRCAQLAQTVEHDGYNCRCHVGGQDAMSVDTDWLESVSVAFAKSVATIQRVRELADTLVGIEGQIIADRILKALDGEVQA